MLHETSEYGLPAILRVVWIEMEAGEKQRIGARLRASALRAHRDEDGVELEDEPEKLAEPTRGLGVEIQDLFDFTRRIANARASLSRKDSQIEDGDLFAARAFFV